MVRCKGNAPANQKGRVLMISMLMIRILTIRVLTIRMLTISMLMIRVLTIGAQGSRRLYVWR